MDVFKYLGRLMAMDDTDPQEIRDNLCKARKVWKMLVHRLLRGETMNPRGLRHVLEGSVVVWE